MTLSNKPGLLGAGLDIRAAGAYVVAPPSLHASGLRYQWDDEQDPIAALPAAIIDKATKLTASLPPAFRPPLLHEGERHDVLFRLACAWRRGAQPADLERRLFAENLNRCRRRGQPEWQLPRYLEAMQEAGFDEVAMPIADTESDGRVWRTVPGRKWYASQMGETGGSKEVVLFHKLRTGGSPQ